MGHIFLPPPLAWGFLLPNPDGSLGAHVPFLSWRLRSRTSPAFCADLGASLGLAGWVRAEVQQEGAPHEGRAAGGGWGDGLWEGCFPWAAGAPSLGTGMGLRNTRGEAAPGFTGWLPGHSG